MDIVHDNNVENSVIVHDMIVDEDGNIGTDIADDEDDAVVVDEESVGMIAAT